MATTTNNRDYELGISVTTAGSEGIRKLQSDVEALAKEGGAAAPEFTKLSQELDKVAQKAETLEAFEKVAQDVNALSTAQAKATGTTREFLAQLADASTATTTLRDRQKELAVQLAAAQKAAGDGRDALKIYKLEADEAKRKTGEYAAEIEKLTRANIANGTAVRNLEAEYKAARATTAQAAAGEAALQKEFQNSALAAQRVTNALGARNAALRDAKAAVDAAGASTDDLAGSNAALTNAVSAAVAEVKRLAAAEKEAAEAAKATAREEDRLAAIVLNTKRQMAQAAQQQLAVEKQVYAEMEQGQARAAAAARAAGQAIDNAFGSVGVRAANAIQQEIAQVRQSLELLKTTGALTGSELDRAFRVGGARITQLERELREATGQMTLMDRAAGALKSTFGQFAAAFTVVEVIQRLGTAFIDTNIKMESLRLGLGTLYKSSTTAAQQIEFLRNTANRAGVSFTGISDSFLKFAASTNEAKIPLSETNALFAAVTQTAGTFGLSADKVTHILDALGQMAAKGTVSMEELRQQLGDSLPGALSVVAKGLGITDQQLVKLVESGGLLARDLFPALTRGLRDNAAEVNTFSATWERFKNIFSDIAVGIADTGAWDGLKGILATTGVLVNGLANGFTLLFDGVVTGGRQMIAVFSGDMKEAIRLGDEFIARQAKQGEKLKENAALLYGLGTAQDRSTAATKENTTAVQANGASHSTATPAVQANAGAQGAAATAATSNAAAQTAAGNAAATAGTQAAAATGSWSSLSIAFNDAKKSGDQVAVVKEKLAKATESAGVASTEYARLTGNERLALSESAMAATANVTALADVERVRKESLASLEAIRNGLVREAQALGDPDGSRAKYIADVQKTIDLRAAEAEQATGALARAKAEADQRTVERQGYEDNTVSLGLYKKAMEDTRLTAQMVAAQEREGFQTKAQLVEANRQAALAEARYNDSLGDTVKSTERSVAAIGRKAEITQSALQVQMLSAQNDERQAVALGNHNLAIEAQVRQREIQIRMTQASAEALRQEAEQTIVTAERQREELTQTGQMTAEKDAEIQARIDNAKVKQLEAQGSDQVVNGIRQEIDAIRTLANAKSGRRGKGNEGPGVIGPNQQVGSTDFGRGQTPGNSPNTYKDSSGNERNRGDGALSGTFGNTLPIDKAFEVRQRGANAFGAADLPFLEQANEQARNASAQFGAMQKVSAGSISIKALQDMQGLLAATSAALTKAREEDAVNQRRSQHTVEFKFPDGGAEQFGMASEDDAARFTKTLSNLSKRTKR